MELSSRMIRFARYGKKISIRILGRVVATLAHKAFLAIGGLALVSYGISFLWRPGAFVIFGSGMVAEAIMIEREERRDVVDSLPPENPDTIL